MATDESSKEGYLISYCADLHLHGTDEYVLKKGTYFHFHPTKRHEPDDCIIICITCTFDCSTLDKGVIEATVNEVLAGKGLTNDVCVLLNDCTSSSNNDIQLRLLIPDNIQHDVTEQQLVTPISGYLTSLGYSVNHIEMTGTLVSSDKIKLIDHGDFKIIPKGTKFQFYYFPPNGGPQKILSLKTEHDSKLEVINKDIHKLINEDMKLTQVIKDKGVLIVKLTYFFVIPGDAVTYMSSHRVGARLENVLGSLGYQYIAVKTESALPPSMSLLSTGSAVIPPTGLKWVCIQVVSINHPVIPNVEDPLSRYFRDAPGGPYDVLTQVPPPTPSILNPPVTCTASIPIN